MAQTPSKPNFRQGQQLGAKTLNAVKEIIPRLVIGSMGDINVNRFGDRISVGMAQDIPSIPESSLFRTFVVREEFDDYLACEVYFQAEEPPQMYDADLGDKLQIDQYGKDVTIYVAKPYLLQKTPWNGQTIDGQYYSYSEMGKRTVGGVEQTIDSYLPGELIVARYCPTGYMVTYPEVSTLTTPPTSDGVRVNEITNPPVSEPPVPITVPIYWQDTNEGGRGFNTGADADFSTRGVLGTKNQIMPIGTKYFGAIAIQEIDNGIGNYPVLGIPNFNDPSQFFDLETQTHTPPPSINPSTDLPNAPPSEIIWLYITSSFQENDLMFLNYLQFPTGDIYTNAVYFRWKQLENGAQLVMNGSDAGLVINGVDGVSASISIGNLTITIDGGVITGLPSISPGPSGTFTTVDGKTITVTDGVITRIV